MLIDIEKQSDLRNWCCRISIICSNGSTLLWFSTWMTLKQMLKRFKWMMGQWKQWSKDVRGCKWAQISGVLEISFSKMRRVNIPFLWFVRILSKFVWSKESGHQTSQISCNLWILFFSINVGLCTVRICLRSWSCFWILEKCNGCTDFASCHGLLWFSAV